MAQNRDGKAVAEDHIIMGVDPGTSLMGYAILRIHGGKPALETMGVIRLSKFEDHYMRLRRIYDRILQLVEQYIPDEMSIEAPFFGKNVQSMLKLGRAQGVAIAAALARQVPIHEYEPRSIKQAITGNGGASKEQVREMLRRILSIPDSALKDLELDATDALAAALCHHYEATRPIPRSGASSWADFVAKNPGRVR